MMGEVENGFGLDIVVAVVRPKLLDDDQVAGRKVE
jgi:hypothetical protein